MTRILVAGGPRTGKTTRAHALARQHGAQLLHSDDVKDLAWSDASAEVARWIDAAHAPWVIEGVAVARALRKWLASHAIGAPCERVVLLTRPWVVLTPGQAAMAKGCATVWAEIESKLARRGVAIDIF